MTVKAVDNDLFMAEVQRLLKEGHEVVIQARGRSMTPFIRHERDRVVLAGDGVVRKGQVVLAHLASGQWVLHRIIRVSPEGILLMGDGNSRGTELCQKKDIVAFATHVKHPSGKVSRLTDQPLWRWLRPVRPLLLKIYLLFHENG